MALEVRASDSIGMRIKTARMAKWLTQEELSDAIKVSRESISLIETDRRFPSVPTLLDLADVLEVSTDYLLGRTNETNISDSNCICNCCVNFHKKEVTE